MKTVKTMKQKTKTERLAPAEYLKLPYMQVIVPEDDGTFRAEVLEFQGCIATGDTREQALASLQDVAESWIESMLATGQEIPPPQEVTDFSGKLVVRMPRGLHRRAAIAADREGVSLNQLIVSAIAECIGLRSQPKTPQITAHVEVLVHATTALDQPRWVGSGRTDRRLFLAPEKRDYA